MFYLVYNLHFRSWKGHSAKKGCWIASIWFGPISSISKFKSSPLEAHSGKEINKLRFFEGWWKETTKLLYKRPAPHDFTVHWALPVTWECPPQKLWLKGMELEAHLLPSRHSLLIPHTQRRAATYHCDSIVVCNAPPCLRDQLTSYSDQNPVLPPDFSAFFPPFSYRTAVLTLFYKWKCSSPKLGKEWDKTPHAM